MSGVYILILSLLVILILIISGVINLRAFLDFPLRMIRKIKCRQYDTVTCQQAAERERKTVPASVRTGAVRIPTH